MKEEKKDRKQLFKILGLVIFMLLFVLSGSLIWGIKNFGNIGMDEILFTLNMSMEGTGSGFITDYMLKVLVPSLIVLVIALFVVFHKKKTERKVWISGKKLAVAFGIWLVVLVISANASFGVIAFAKNQLSQSHFIEEEYVEPAEAKLEFPEKKRNLIYILLESGESSDQDKANGGLFDENYIPEMTQIAKDNVSFSQSDLIEGAAVAPACGWTMAGMVAEFSGLPLKLYEYDDGDTDNSMGDYKFFLPGVTNLGDILNANGYHNYYMIGSDARFSGRDNYMKQHGDYEIWDYYTAIEKGKIPPDYHVWWGYEDRKLYEYAKEELTRLSQEPEPFNFTMLTVDTHHVDGYKCPLCQDQYDKQYANVWACASRQLNDFVNWIKLQPFYENTTIVISGDHCSMDPNFFGDYKYDKHNGELTRKVYNAVINAPIEPVKEKNRKFVTMDMFPTTLAALGVKIEGDRLALGTNLFSDKETLSEEFGYDVIFEELNKKSKFYDYQLLYKGKEEDQ